MNVKVGDLMVRMLAGTIPMTVKVTAVDESTITCGYWTFDLATGAEIDKDLGWGPATGVTGSFLEPRKQCNSTSL